MLRSITLAALLLFALLWTMTVVAAKENTLAALQSAAQASLSSASINVTPTGVITVTTTDDEVNSDGDCSLREAIQAADTEAAVDGCFPGSGGETIYVPAGLYQLSQGQLELTGTVTLQGSITDTTILDGVGSYRILYIDHGASVTLQRLEIRNGLGSCPACEYPYYDGTGGGIANYGTTLIAQSTIHNNRAEVTASNPYDTEGADGGGIFNAGILTIINSTISGNAAGDGDPNGDSHSGVIACSNGGEGGGIANFGKLTVENSTVTNNKPGKGGPADGTCAPSQDGSGTVGGIYNESRASAFVKNSVIAGNQANDCGGAITSQGYNILQTIAGCTIHGEPTDRYWAAHLNPLFDNGGPTPTHALDRNSPAIDAGDCTDSTGRTITVDQRGEPRPQGDGCDIGAYESPFTSTFTIRDTVLPAILSPTCAHILTMCNLTRNPELDRSPSWSPDGNRIAFVRVGVEAGIYVMNADGSTPIKLVEYGELPIWSPDGSKIAFLNRAGNDTEIYVMDANGNHLTNVTNTSATAESVPVWSPDGSKILFESGDANSCCAPNLYVMNADGSQKSMLVSNAFISSAPWSPDGSKIAYADSAQVRGFHILGVNGSNPIDLTINLTISGQSQSTPMWSPDGNKIAYDCEISSTGQLDICIMNSDGSRQTNLTNDDALDFGPTWSPDSSKLLFQRRYSITNNVEIASINAAGGAITQLTSTAADFYVGNAVWAPDSHKIAYVSGRYSSNFVIPNFEIFVLGVGD